jgi:hypothetical protein
MSTLGVGMMNQLGDALEREGYSPDLITKLRSDSHLLKQLKSILSGSATVKLRYMIDDGGRSTIEQGWSIEYNHSLFGKFEWDESKAKLYLSLQQRNGNIRASILRRQLTRKPVLNAAVLDFLLAHPEMIPEDWKMRGNICFWGTVYCDPHGALRVRHLFWGDKEGWCECYGSLDIAHDDRYPIAIYL